MKNILLAIAILFIGNTYSQVLYNETFTNYTVGNLGTDPNGVIPGQGGWLTLCWNTKSNSFFNIVNEANRGKVLDLTTNYTKNAETFSLIKSNIEKLIDTRTPGNDVIKFEIDFFTGNQIPIGAFSLITLPLEDFTGTHYVFQLHFNKQTGHISGVTGFPNPQTTKRNVILNGNNEVYLPFVAWITFVVYLDYPNDKLYVEIPYFNKVFSGSLRGHNANNLIQDFKPIGLTMITSFQSNGNYNVFSSQRFDNIKITALNAVPPYVLSSVEISADKFNLYPNPASNVVNITNSENMFVKEVAVYDTTGKLINTQSFNEQAEIQLNVEKLASGTYMLHLQTNEGTAVKKLVKK